MSRALFYFSQTTRRWAFDTGLALAQRTVLRRGAIALLAELARPVGYLQAVIGWGGTIRSHQDIDGIDQLHAALSGRAPGIAVSLLDAETTDRTIGGFASKAQIEMSVYFYSNHSRGDVEGRLEPDNVALVDDTADPGLEIAMEHAKELLIGQYPGSHKSIKQIALQREEHLVTTEFTIFVQRYVVLVDQIINRDRKVTQRVTEFMTTVRHATDEEPPILQALTVLSPPGS